MPKPGGTAARGYGHEHQRIRRALLPTAYGKPCTRCGKPMLPGQPLDLDHTDDRSGYQGFAHRSCNRSAGAVKRNAGRGVNTISSRRW